MFRLLLLSSVVSVFSFHCSDVACLSMFTLRNDSEQALRAEYLIDEMRSYPYNCKHVLCIFLRIKIDSFHKHNEPTCF